MLALARALAVPPRLIIADEMSLGLAPIVAESVFRSLKLAAQAGITIVLIEQFVHRALELADQQLAIGQAGQLVMVRLVLTLYRDGRVDVDGGERERE